MRNIVYNGNHLLIDNGLLFGRGVFETILIKGKAQFLEEHIVRLNKGIRELAIGEPIGIEEVLKIISEYKLDNIALKIAVTEKNLIFTTRDIKYTEESYKNGFKVKFSEGMRNSKARTTYIKSLNYLDNLLEYEKANKEGFNEALFFNELDKLTEGCTTNVFIIKDKIIYTPLEKCGLLKGIVRQFIIDNFNVVEKEISREELIDADEVFLTNSLVGVIKVSEIEGHKYSSKILEEIREVYEDFITLGRMKKHG